MLKNKYKNMPSMGEYAMRKFRKRYIPSTGFEYFIKANNTNELDYYHKYIQFVKEYEQKYLMENNVEYVINHKPELPFRNILGNMKKRWAMYLGGYNLENIRAFFDGYIRCKYDYGIRIDDFENKMSLSQNP